MLHKAVQYSSFITEQMSKYQAEILGSKEQARPPASLQACRCAVQCPREPWPSMLCGSWIRSCRRSTTLFTTATASLSDSHSVIHSACTG